MKNPKLWDVKKYNQLVALMKKKFPCITIVSIGQNYNFGKIEGVDIDLVGRTTLNDVKVVLKHSILHIGVEGGLVHLNHFLYGTSCCMFGPTSKYFFGYEENININSGIPQQCDNGCEGIIFNWMSYGCFLDKEPICMKTLSAELVFDCISKYLKELPQTDYQIIEVLKREEDIIRKWSAEVSKVSNIAIVNYVENEYMNDILEYGENIIIFERNLKELDKNSYCKKYNVEFEYGNIYNIPVREATYELVINFTIEHEEYPEYALKELLRVLQYSGKLILCCENNNILQKSLAWNGIKIEKLTGYSGQVLMQIQKHNKI